jgi:Tfp pilus assembly protein PilX
MKRDRARQAGVALPVMLIILAVMLVSTIYLLKSSNSTTLAVSNLAYDSRQSRAADLGLHEGFKWLSDTAAGSKAALNADDTAHAYLASLDTSLTVRDGAFWAGSIKLADAATGNTVEYVIHRLCAVQGPYDAQANACVQTAANTSTLGNTTPLGESLAADAPSFASTPQVHYLITARIFGARGGNVVNQLVVLIGA